MVDAVVDAVVDAEGDARDDAPVDAMVGEAADAAVVGGEPGNGGTSGIIGSSMAELEENVADLTLTS